MLRGRTYSAAGSSAATSEGDRMASTTPRPEWGSQRSSAQQVPAPPVANERRSFLDAFASLPFAIVGLLLVVGGAVLQAVAILGAPWLKTTVDQVTVRYGFGDFNARTQRGLAYMYFAYGAWVLLALSLILGVAACLRWRRAQVFRYVGAIFSVLAAFVSIGAVVTFAYQSHNPVFHVAGNYAIGIYLATLGLLASAIGTAAGGVSGRFARR
jgi:hypothetical protein